MGGCLVGSELTVRVACPQCDGVGAREGEPWCVGCDAAGQICRTPTPADLVAHVSALPADERQAFVEAIVEWDPLLHVWRSPKPAAVFEVACFDTEEEAVAYAREHEGDHLLTTPEVVTKYVAGLPADEAQALLVALLRAVPDVAVAAVDACKVARAWALRDGCEWEREHLGRSPDGDPVACAPYRDHADAALLADGWVLAKGVTP